jgi:hypothetical protein
VSESSRPSHAFHEAWRQKWIQLRKAGLPITPIRMVLFEAILRFLLRQQLLELFVDLDMLDLVGIQRPLRLAAYLERVRDYWRIYV